MGLFNSRLDVRGKIIVILIIIGALSASAIGWIGYTSGRDNLTERISAELSIRRDLTADAIVDYYTRTRTKIAVLGEGSTVREALRDLPDLFDSVEAPTNSQREKLSAFYQDDFLPSLPGSDSEAQLADSFLPSSEAALSLQALYIASKGQTSTNLEEKPGLANYRAYHNRIDEYLSKLSEALEYRDLFLIGPDGRVLYTVDKEVDFATNLSDGPFDTSGLARAYNAARGQRGTRFVHVEDFDFYRPSGGAPAAFMATPVYDQGVFLGVLALQLSTDWTQNLVTKAGIIGKTGEVYLAGADGLLRSDLRSFIADKEGFLESAKQQGIEKRSLDAAGRFGTGIRLLNVENEAVLSALRGEESVMVFKALYGGHSLLAAAKPLDIEGLDWAIIAEVAVSEAYEPIRKFQRQIVITVTALAIAVTLFAMWAAGLITRPVNSLIDRAKAMSSGNFDTPMTLPREDEFGELSDHLQKLTDNLRNQRDASEKAREDTEKLLTRFMPERIVRELRKIDREKGNGSLAEPVGDVTMIMAELVGYDEIVFKKSPEQGVAILDALIQKIDAATESTGVEKVRTAGPSYVAAAGLSTPQIDHAQRAVAFGFELVTLIERFSAESGLDIKVTVGIASGPLLATIVGDSLLAFELFGPCKEEARRFSKIGEPNEILVNQAVADSVGDHYEIMPSITGLGFVIKRTSSAKGASQ